MPGADAREKAYARKGLLRDLAPLALLLSFQGGFGIAVMVLDRANRALPSDAGYVLAVESCLVAAVLAVSAARIRAARLRVARALRDPLGSEPPPAGSRVEEAWRDLAQAARSEARRGIASAKAEGRAELGAFLASVHAIKTPATALSLMAQRAMAEGSAIAAADAGLEIDELCRAVDLALGRLRLGDFESGSRLSRVEAAGAARDCLKRHRRLFVARGVSVSVEGEAEVETDSWWLGFILDQLLSNAAKYASSRLAIRVSAEGGEGILRFEDDGPGFGPEDRAWAFGKSAAGSLGGRGRPDAGPASSGYGLYLASEAARRLGARLELLEGGNGAALLLALPLVRDPLARERIAEDLADS